MAPGTSSHAGIHCSHLSSGQQLPVQSYLQGNETEYEFNKWREFYSPTKYPYFSYNIKPIWLYF